MQTHNNCHYRSRGWTVPKVRRLGAICIFAAIIALGRAAQPPAPKPVAPPITHDLQFVKSVFVATPGPGFGTDPFFPTTKRFQHVRTNTTEQPGPVNFLSLKGISRAGNRRMAIINNRTFEVGEEGEVKINGLPFRIRCIEIRDDGVTVSVNGQLQKLSLAPK